MRSGRRDLHHRCLHVAGRAEPSTGSPSMIAFLDQVAMVLGWAALSVSVAVGLLVVSAPFGRRSRRCRAGLRVVESSAQVVDLAQYRRDCHGDAA